MLLQWPQNCTKMNFTTQNKLLEPIVIKDWELSPKFWRSNTWTTKFSRDSQWNNTQLLSRFSKTHVFPSKTWSTEWSDMKSKKLRLSWMTMARINPRLMFSTCVKNATKSRIMKILPFRLDTTESLISTEPLNKSSNLLKVILKLKSRESEWKPLKNCNISLNQKREKTRILRFQNWNGPSIMLMTNLLWRLVTRNIFFSLELSISILTTNLWSKNKEKLTAQPKLEDIPNTLRENSRLMLLKISCTLCSSL